MLQRKEPNRRALHLFSQIIMSCWNHQEGRAITWETHLPKCPLLPMLLFCS